MSESTRKFVVVRTAGPEEGWEVDGPEVEAVWLPRVGPTAWALLRYFDHVGAHSPCEYYSSAVVAKFLGTSPSRAWATVLRLENFRAIAAARPACSTDRTRWFALPHRLPPLRLDEWRKLPDVVQRLHIGLAPPVPAPQQRRRGQRGSRAQGCVVSARCAAF